MIKPDDIGGDVDLARRVIVIARSIAPCLDSLEDGSGEDDPKYKSDAIAILKGVVAHVVKRGSTAVKSQGIGSARIEYVVSGSSFSDDDRNGLRSLCSAAPSSTASSQGSFPPPSRVVAHLWPEGR